MAENRERILVNNTDEESLDQLKKEISAFLRISLHPFSVTVSLSSVPSHFTRIL